MVYNSAVYVLYNPSPFIVNKLNTVMRQEEPMIQEQTPVHVIQNNLEALILICVND